INYADYFLAAWQYKNRATRGKPNATLADIAAQEKLSAKYLATVSVALTEKQEQGPIAALQRLWETIPNDAKLDDARATCAKMQSFIADFRPKLKPVVDNLKSPKIQDGTQPLVIWKNEQMAANHTKYAPGSALKLKQWQLPANSTAAKAI